MIIIDITIILETTSKEQEHGRNNINNSNDNGYIYNTSDGYKGGKNDNNDNNSDKNNHNDDEDNDSSNNDMHWQIHPSFLSARVPHGEPPGKDLTHLRLFTTGLFNLPKPRHPR